MPSAAERMDDPVLDDLMPGFLFDYSKIRPSTPDQPMDVDKKCEVEK